MIKNNDRTLLLKSLMLGACLYALCATHHTLASTKQYSPATSGFLGLNTIPNARMDKVGTLRVGTSTLAPYLHGYVGLQVTPALSVVLRQSAETSDITDSPRRLYPGLDFKLRLLNEKERRPALVIGAQSAFGHKRTSGEYIAMSKRYHNFDFTAGLGWGRFGTANHLDNPLHIFGNHFKKDRDFNSETANTPENWFTGEHVGFFGGIEYFTPLKGLSLKFDYGADRYVGEQASFDFNAGAPWTIGMDYTYKNWLTAGIGVQGDDKVMARLSFQSNPQSWTLSNNHKSKKSPNLQNITNSEKTIHADLHLPNTNDTPSHIGSALRQITENAPPEIEEIQITTHDNGLTGRTLSIMRQDFDNALHHKGSPQEVWDNLKILPKNDTASAKNTSLKYDIIFDNQVSLAEDEVGILHRSSLIPQVKLHAFKGLNIAGGLRLNIGDNLFDFEDSRGGNQKPIRSNINKFTNTLISLDTGYLNYTHTLAQDIYATATIGYLEELFAGYGMEILYRPYKSKMAVGIEGWHAKQRDPTTHLNLGLSNRKTTSAFLNLWYNMPKYNMVVTSKTGRFLQGDVGTRLGVEKIFENGAKIKGQITATNERNLDAFGGTTNIYHGLTLSIPLGSIPKVPKNSVIKASVKPFGRDTGQTLNLREDIYEKTQKLSYGNLVKNWKNILDK